MNNLLKDEAIIHGDRLQIVSLHHVCDLKDDIELFAQSEILNDFQKWIINDLYNYSIPSANFTVQSIILMALSHPFYADVIFNKSGKEYLGKCLVRSNFDEADKYLKTYLGKFGYHAERANNLPLKRLGVQSGLSEYGRNNITYINGMGSNFSLVAYFSDIPCENDTWRNAATARACDNCNVCINNCPTGAIIKERFLIDNQKCLSAINETPGDFPEWLPMSVHHTCYDCLRCQEKCPMNIGHIDKMTKCFMFSEQETEMLLQGNLIENFSEDTKQKIFTLGLDEWYEAIPRNIKALMNIG
jgi:epoxyqueuosine reductase